MGAVTNIATKRKLVVATMTSRKSSLGHKRMTWEAYVNLFRETQRTTETVAEYAKLPKTVQDEIKDTGGTIPAKFSGRKRKRSEIETRSAVTLDADHCTGETLAAIECALAGRAYIIHSTHKHTPESPRYRVILPLQRDVSAEEYAPIARKIAERIGIQYFDKTTYEPERLMYWPSTSRDGEYVFREGVGDFVNPDKVLAEYVNWRDVNEWPTRADEADSVAGMVAKGKAEDPLSKNNIVGAVCRAFSMQDAIARFLPEVYLPGADGASYTYAGGSTANGAKIFEDKFIFSYHDSDPLSNGHVHNVFDAVRIHKFGVLDDGIRATSGEDSYYRRPSYKRAVEFFGELPEVRVELMDLRLQQARAEEWGDEGDGGGVASREAEGGSGGDGEWRVALDINAETGAIKNRLVNLDIIMRHDRQLAGKIAFNTLRGTIVARDRIECCDLTEANQVDGVAWEDKHELLLRKYFETEYKLELSKDRCADMVTMVAHQREYSPVLEMLTELEWEWDGIARTPFLFLNYMTGCEDNAYIRAIGRKFMLAAVSRQFEPGCKWDYVPILEGPQGLGKGRFIEALAMRDAWFSDSLTSFDGKEAIEAMQGAWIIELPELQGFGKTEIEHLKAFISRRRDKARMAYARRQQEFPRSCVFVGTTNEDKYLRDETGNRRFMPVNCRSVDVDALKRDVRQLWAEAVWRYHNDKEPLWLEDEEALALSVTEQTRRVDDGGLASVIEDKLDELIPSNYWDAGVAADFDESVTMVERDRTNPMDIWVYCLGGAPKEFDTKQSRRIGRAMAALKHKWGPIGSHRFGNHRTRGFRRV